MFKYDCASLLNLTASATTSPPQAKLPLFSLELLLPSPVTLFYIAKMDLSTISATCIQHIHLSNILFCFPRERTVGIQR